MDRQTSTSSTASGAGTGAVLDYHLRTAHRFEGFARGPDTLDWDTQPAPFRHYSDCPTVALPLVHQARAPELQAALARPFDTLEASAPAVPLGLEAIGALLHLSFGLTAWKSFGPDRWALRANPSSGNLHPVEAWVISCAIPGLADGVHHYRPERHALSLRAADPAASGAPPMLALAVSSVMWREAWKYGERAFRYCQLDVGHALGTLRYAAAVLGWRLDEQRQVGHDTLAARLGLDRAADFPARRDASSEREEPELLLSVGAGEAPPRLAAPALREAAAAARWHGTASTIDPFPMYRWPVIAEVAAATRRADGHAMAAVAAPARAAQPAPPGMHGSRATALILQRRSAQRFDAGHSMSRPAFEHLVAALAASRRVPFDILPEQAQVDLMLMVHRVDGLPAGLYLLARQAASPLPATLARVVPDPAAIVPVPGLPLLAVRETPAATLKRLARSLHCHQDIAASACLAVGMVAPLDAALATDPAAYRDLHRAAGLIGQCLYLEAEAAGLRGTGIGCYFDEPVRDALGLADSGLRTLYHFTVGRPLDDARIETTPAYADLTQADDFMETDR
jgi:SagB-type dehydrogenase family enzyme